MAASSPKNHPKPVIGIAGGIGSGKSTIARMFGQLGCRVIDSDRVAHEVLQSEPVKSEILRWLGPSILHADGSVNRKAVGRIVFSDKAALARLNGLIHPQVDAVRIERMNSAFSDENVRAIVLDSPLLFEAGLNASCDAIVFVNVPYEQRLQRVMAARNWAPDELARREKSQVSLDNKRQSADYVLDNTGLEAASLRQVQLVLSQILAEKP